MSSRALRWMLVCLLLNAAACRPPAKPEAQRPAAPEKTATAAPAPAVIGAHTSGEISRQGVIRVRFNEAMVPEEKVNEPLASSPLSFEPGIAGIALWVDPQELQFRPAEALPPGQRYRAALALAGLTQGQGEARFDFEFGVLQQSFELSVLGLEAASDNDPAPQLLRGSITTADVAAGPDIERMLRASHEGTALQLSWEHDHARQQHAFTVAGIQRREEDTRVVLQLDGKPIGVERGEEQEIRVEGLNTFALIDSRTVLGDQSYLELRFSDPLAPKQNLRGLITVASHKQLRFEIERNLVKVFSAKGWAHAIEIEVAAGVKNARGFKLKAPQKLSLSFEALKPAVRFATKGVVIPTTEGLTVPIEVANLRWVQVEAVQVFAANLPQFLQVNPLGGSEELRRVGRTVWRGRVPVAPTPGDRDRWMRIGLDVSRLIQADPGGLYHLSLGFGRGDIVYDCPGQPEVAAEDSSLSQADDEAWVQPQEASSWDGAETAWGMADAFSDWYGETSYWDAYQNREDPCHPGYYRPYNDHDIRARRSVLVSDIGLIAKHGSDGSLAVVATDLRSAQPLADVELRVLDFQLQEMARGRSGADGLWTAALDRRPFAVTASNGKQAAYLKLDDGSSLALGHFDVAGAQVQKGIKGFFYGERGVWRPGDDIFLTFILLDAEGKLPAQHPVQFELQSPRGQIEQRLTRDRSVNGFYSFVTRTRPDAPTGNYVARARVGGAVFEKTLAIETVVPNRLKIGLDFGADMIEAGAERIETQLSAQWLHGALASGLRATIQGSFVPRPTRFDRYEGFHFDDPSRSYSSEPEELFDGQLDETGKAAVSLDLMPAGRGPPGMLTANLVTRVFEPSGAFSIDRFSVPLAPYPRFVGVKAPKGDAARGMLLTDQDHAVQVVAVDARGKPAGNVAVEMKLYKINWRWWWEKGEERLADYAGTSAHTALAQGTVQLKDGKGQWSFQIKYPDWGRYLILATDPEGGHRSGQILYVDWPGWAGRAQKDQPGGASVLSFSADKAEYDVGQTVTLNIPTSQGGRGLVSLETGSRVLRTAWIEPQGEMTRYSFEASADMSPTVYAHVTLVQPHLKSGNDLPIRLYGVVPLKVVDPATRLQPQIACAEVFAPEAEAKVQVKEAAGRAMTYTLAVVDEGLLGLTRYKTPDPWDHFFSRESIGVKTWDLYSLVAGAFGGELEKHLAIGGDGEGEDEGAQSKAQRFKPMVRFMGPFTLAAGAAGDHRIDVPQYIGEVRVMVVAGQGKAFGMAERSVKVRKPLMVAATLPRVLGPGEKLSLPVAVFALEDKVKQVELTVAVEGPLELSGKASRSVRFDGPGDKLVSFDLAVPERLGVARVKVEASGGGERAAHQIEIAVRHPGERDTAVTGLTVNAGASVRQDVQLVGMAGTNQATLEISTMPPLDLERRLSFLVQYPHGCVEQTTSAAFPQVYLSQLLKLTPGQAERASTHIKVALDKLKGFQHPSGGFAYWPGQAQVRDWTTSYVGHFLLEAKQAGYALPSGMIDQWKKYQREIAQRWADGDQWSQLEQAYRLYTLALAGAPELGAMNRLRERAGIDPTARWRLAAAYALAGQKESARGLLKGLGTEVRDYTQLSGTFGSGLRDRAMILETLLLLDDLAQALPLARQISQELTTARWHGTHETAYALIAMARLGLKSGQHQRMSFAYRVGGGEAVQIESDRPVVSLPLEAGKATRLALQIDNRGQPVLFARVIASGLPPVGKEQARSNGLRVQVSYEGIKGSSLDPSRLEQGTDLIAKVTVSNTSGRPLQEIALAQIVPSGWEIHNERLDPGWRQGSSAFSYQDVRDDRVYTYFDLGPGQSQTFDVSVNASYLGKFYLPPVSAECMYDASINGRELGQWIEVVEPGEVG